MLSRKCHYRCAKAFQFHQERGILSVIWFSSVFCSDSNTEFAVVNNKESIESLARLHLALYSPPQRPMKLDRALLLLPAAQMQLLCPPYTKGLRWLWWFRAIEWRGYRPRFFWFGGTACRSQPTIFLREPVRATVFGWAPTNDFPRPSSLEGVYSFLELRSHRECSNTNVLYGGHQSA